ncbi:MULTISPECIES: bleomycin resistance protein [Myroides]|uniref:Bleomycin resistance protein n=1 Tax=Myroides odoratimimus TaxID=76832 RepID=A0AAI8C5V0_9FLAO|nr:MULTISPECIES: VOC family protein [Myroides]ALU26542.1 glyoxalase [Myroides odoratimimus]APA92601.1 bleomycin resistance family protein [Myroides sp. ZB35]MCS7473606.1 VOC family protein [Myroides odoratimimus]MDM1034403.1 VOC family protein [Myroides odoratimimus]MDM1036978.1 VOC family protein [Myroides odoratimimus]
MRSDNIKWAALVPEFVVSDLAISLQFWCDYIGFEVMYDRKEEHFAYLGMGEAQVMLEQYNPADREWETGILEKPYGRGINFQIEVNAIIPILKRLQEANYTLFIDAEERWYRADDVEFGQKQFLVQDPDGYLLRLIENLGERKLAE